MLLVARSGRAEKEKSALADIEEFFTALSVMWAAQAMLSPWNF
jgi:hypothetical protein